MNDATIENAFPSDFQRAKDVLKAERHVTASLLQRRLGIGYSSAVALTAELRRLQPDSAVRPDCDLIMDSRTHHLLLAIWDGPHGIEDIQISQDELDALLTRDAAWSKLTITSVVGKSSEPNRACLAVRNAVGATEEIAQALHAAKRLIVLIGAVSETLKGREIKIVLSELRRRVDQSCSISLGIRYLEHSEDAHLSVTVIFSW